MSVRFGVALLTGKFCAAFAGKFFPKRGTNLPGEIALKFDPLFLRHVKGTDPAKTIFITGTNGKSTTNNLILHVFAAAGLSVASNAEGANLKAGAATVLLKNTAASGRFTKDWLILEVDERSLAGIQKDLKAGTICVTNIQKDQVQRNGDPDYIYQKIRAAIDDSVTVIANNEEPHTRALAVGAADAEGMGIAGHAGSTEDVKFAGRESTGRAVTFGVAVNKHASTVEVDFGVSMPCPVCGDALLFEHRNLANVGFFHCPACDFASADTADYTVIGTDFEGGRFRLRTPDGREAGPFRLAYTAAHFLYNYALCCAVCMEAGIGSDILTQAFASFINIGGRLESFAHKGKDITYIRIKQENPETLQSALDTIAADKRNKIFVLGPAVVDDFVPHYTNTFYAFDCDFGPMLSSGTERCICFGTTISFDVANRLRYAGVPDDRIQILDTDEEEAILTEIAKSEAEVVYLITWIKKYEKLRACSVEKMD
ncbi:UDP-N-acetylmuramyl peptide synthase [Clostridia bacterium]|nr:UDP-N-acetylmuramyl peptide synthase [Clostridia bacterium]